MKSAIKLMLLTVSISFCLNAFSANTINKITYKWTDKNGIIQYTERPPKSRAYERITISASGGKEVEEVSKDQATTKVESNKSSGLDELAATNKRNCAIAKQNLDVLTKLARIKVKDANGEERILTVEEKAAQENETRKEIEIYCKAK